MLGIQQMLVSRYQLFVLPGHQNPLSRVLPGGKIFRIKKPPAFQSYKKTPARPISPVAYFRSVVVVVFSIFNAGWRWSVSRHVFPGLFPRELCSPPGDLPLNWSIFFKFHFLSRWRTDESFRFLEIILFAPFVSSGSVIVWKKNME